MFGGTSSFDNARDGNICVDDTELKIEYLKLRTPLALLDMCSKDSRSLANRSNLFQISSHGSSILRYRHTTLGMGLGSPLSALEGGEYEPSAGPWKTPTTNIRDFILIFTTSRPDRSHCTCCFSHFCRSHRAVGFTRFVPRDRCSGGISVRRSRAACVSRLKSSCMRCGIHFSRCRFRQDSSTLTR